MNIVIARKVSLLGVTMLSLAAGLTLPLAVPAQAAGAPTIVSLTFDDGVADVYQARDALLAHGMNGTFFVNSGRIGTSGYLTSAQLQQLAADGNEIGGHTVQHADLQAVSPDEARREICMDRSTLLGLGYQVSSFAYPYSSVSSTVQGYAQDCGYNSARQVGDITSPGGCPGCDFAETIPPANLYYTRAPDSVLSTWSLNDVKGLVTQAESHGGGWVQVVFHHICNACDPYSITTTDFTAFLDWLAARNAGGTVVRRVNDVVSGPVQPAVTGPASPAPAPFGVNGAVNAGLEQSGTGSLPYCWQTGGSGTNTASWSRTSGAHGGSFAEQVTISSWTSGDRKLLPRMDLGQCSPSVTPGHVYRVSTWYKSTGSSAFALYYRNSIGAWYYWTSSPSFPASSEWTEATWSAPAVPASATAMSFGLALRSVGTLTTDDYTIVDTTSPPDTTPPSVSVTAPTDGAEVGGFVTVQASASDDGAVSRVDFLVDGVVIGSASSAPFATTWDSSTVANGAHNVTAIATDAASNSSPSSPVGITVSNTVPNLLVNPGLESLTGSVPTCWQTGSSGSNTGSLSVSSTAHSGTRGERVQITSWTSGDRKLVVKQDAGTCAPATQAGRIYQLSTYYQSDAPLKFVVYYRSSTGRWVYWISSPTLAASSSWLRAVYTTPPMPAGSTALSFGLALSSVGTATTDDYSLNDVTPPADTIAPTVALTSPPDGSVVSGVVGVSATASDDRAVVSVDFLVDGVVVAHDDAEPWAGTWDSTSLTGEHVITARAADAAGNVTTSAPVTVTADNPVGPVNLLVNPGLESATSGVPTCWKPSGSGTSSFTFARTSDAHSGAWAERLDMTGWTSGDRKLVVTQDAGTCAPAALSGHVYRASVWTKASVTTNLVIYYRDSGGVWRYWLTGPTIPASSGWIQSTLQTPPLPAGAKALSFGVALAKVGTLTTDDYMLEDLG